MDTTNKTKCLLAGWLGISLLGCEQIEVPPPVNRDAPLKQVHMLTWEDYFPDSSVEKFEQESGYQLVQHYFDNTDDGFGLMKAQPHRYDIIVISHSDLPVFASHSLIRKLDHARLAGTEGIGKHFRRMPNDPNNAYSLPFLWGGFAVAYRKDLISDPETSFRLFFEDDTPGKRLIFDEAADVIAVTNTLSGRPLADYSDQAFEFADRVFSAAPRAAEVELQPSSQMIGSLVAGDFVVAINYSGDIAAAAEDNPNVGYFLPDEGTPLWLDTLTISRDSPNPEGAYALLNFLLEPENIAEVSNDLWYPNAVPESYPMISEELRADQVLFPQEEIVEQSHWCISPAGAETGRLARFLRSLTKDRTAGTENETSTGPN